ncbi:protein MOS2-like [Lycium barbarum]|uniref:protein MOS2-like n=1 Tax=Lycium barbarum TaxID=112863 RepID=UPI00293E9032|nr:protein MOS2-like [Lycium barbarum]
MNVSFSLSLSSKPRKQQPSCSNLRKEQASCSKEFDPSKPPSSSTKQIIILPKHNERCPIERMKNLDDQFEIDNGGTPTVDGISYGLNVRRQSENHNPKQSMLHKLREDLKRLPGIDECSDMPVEGFAAALLKGYGWVEGRGIGRNAKQDVKVVEYKKGCTGFGFIGKAKQGLYAGKEVRGKEMGMKGVVLEVKTGGVLVVSTRDDEVQVRARDVAELGSLEEQSCLTELKIKQEKSNLAGRKRSRDETSASWLAPHIRVRIIIKDLKRGRLYLKKGVTMDVVGPTSCDICMDETRELIQGVDQDLLERALPKRGGPVLVLYGRHKGVYGHLVDKDSENETAIVRDADTKELLKVRLEQIAEYLGDPNHLLGRVLF